MNFAERMNSGESKKPEQEAQGVKPVAENKQATPENIILGASKDENFPDATVVKTRDKEGKEKGYALRMKEDGTFEGNEINYQPDGSIGSVQKLNEDDLAKLEQQGVLEEYKKTKKTEGTERQESGRIHLMRLFLKGDHINPQFAHTRNEETKMSLQEAKKNMDDLNPAEQEALAEEFYNSTIGKHITNNKDAYNVYLNFKGTSFAERFKQLEDKRLKEAGYDGFNI